jgi:phosphatidylglycerophosphate synthase
MDRTRARRIADAFTWARIWSALPITLFAWYGLRWWVLGLYIAAALTDLADGYFGRRADPPAKDTDFDGKADLLFSVMTLVWVWMLVPGFVEAYWLPYLPILLVIEAYMINVRVRWPETTIPHFQFGRVIMALFCLLLPVLLVFGDTPWFVHTVLILGTASKIQLAWYLWNREKQVA